MSCSSSVFTFVGSCDQGCFCFFLTCHDKKAIWLTDVDVQVQPGSLIERNGRNRWMLLRCVSSRSNATTLHRLYKNSSAISCKEKEKPSVATTCDIYPGWLLKGSFAVAVGPTSLSAEAGVFAAADAEQMRRFQTVSRKLHGQPQYLNSYMTLEHKWKCCRCACWRVCWAHIAWNKTSTRRLSAARRPDYLLSFKFAAEQAKSVVSDEASKRSVDGWWQLACSSSVLFPINCRSPHARSAFDSNPDHDDCRKLLQSSSCFDHSIFPQTDMISRLLCFISSWTRSGCRCG